MRQQVILDTGSLVAFINRRDRFHDRVAAELTTEIKQFTILTTNSSQGEKLKCEELFKLQLY